ncbi:HAD-IIIC family phosphatase, partial [Clostridium sp. UBA6640]|uniref:HAD-IIIC family phosphatase n=1 Tax=Clostridium sp. UBA6640 TaxID=1946370 RepID=UPI0025C309AC
MKTKKTKYKEFLKWRLEQNQDETIEYWKQYLRGFIGYNKNYIGKKKLKTMHYYTDNIDSKIIYEIKEYSKKNKVSIATIFYSAWAYTRHIIENSDEITFATTFSGRTSEIEDIDQIVGMFINTLPIRSKLKEYETCRQYILFFEECLRKHQSYQYQSLADIKCSLGIQHERELFNNLFVIENYPLKNISQEEDKIKILDYQLVEESNFDLTVQIITFDEYKINVAYDSNRISSSTIEIMMSCYKQSLINLIADGDTNLLDVQILNEKEKKDLVEAVKENKISKLDYESNEEKNITDVVVAATFTAEPIGAYIEWWCNKFNEKVKVKFAPYNQVFQQLIDQNSLVANNFGINVILMRFEDLIRHVKEEKDKIIILKKSYDDICKLISKEYKGITLFGVFPISTHLNLSKEIVDLIEELSDKIIEQIKLNKKILILDYNNLDKLYNIKQIFNEVTDREGHLPFESEYYAAMGTMIARKICSIKKTSFKVIVLDCDNTLWGGICGEDGGECVNIKDEFEEFHRFLVQKYNEGVLLALCSKNNEKDVWNVFEKRKEMVLKREHIVAYKINWRNKDENIKELSQELNLGLDSFIFLDDNPMEIAKVMLNCPEVLCLKLPKESKLIPIFLQHVWAFDKERITYEDMNRTKMYKAEEKRIEMKNKLNSIDTFLKNLNLKVSMKLLNQAHIDRVSQLTWRTNQFNLSTIRRSEEQIKELINNNDYKCWEIEAEDIFGEYGVVGILITQKIDSKLFIDSFLLSCRILGKGIEHSILLGIKKYCLKENIQTVTMRYYPTYKNKPVLDFINSGLWRKLKQTDEFIEYEIYCYEIPDTLKYIDFYFEQSFHKELEKCNKSCFNENFAKYKTNI